MMALAGVELETLVSDPDALTTRLPSSARQKSVAQNLFLSSSLLNEVKIFRPNIDGRVLRLTAQQHAAVAWVLQKSFEKK